MNLHPKAKASGAAGAIVTIIVIIAAQFGVTIDAQVSAALVTILSFLAAYITPSPAA